MTEIFCWDLGKLCDINSMRNIRRALQRKQFYLWRPETAVARDKRRKRFLRLWREPMRPGDDCVDKMGYGEVG
jgi:hypothetical protein